LKFFIHSTLSWFIENPYIHSFPPPISFTTTSRTIPYGVVDVNEYSYEWQLVAVDDEGAVAEGDQAMIQLHRYTKPIENFCPPKKKI